MNKQKIIITIMIFLIFSQIVIAEVVPVNTNQEIVTNEQLKNLITSESIKIRSENSLYIDRKVNELTTTFQTEGQKFFDDNIRVFDQRVHDLALKIQIQIIIGIIAAIILGNAFWFFLKRLILKKEEKRPTHITMDTYTAQRYGLISSDYAEKIKKEDETVIRQIIHKDEKINPEPPSIDIIEQMIKNKKLKEEQEKAAIQQEKLLKEYEKKNQEKNKKEKEIQKLQEKANQKTKRIREKLEKTLQQKNSLEQDMNKIIPSKEPLPPLPPPIPPKEFKQGI